VNIRWSKGKQFYVNRIEFQRQHNDRTTPWRAARCACTRVDVFNAELSSRASSALNQLGYFKPLEASPTKSRVDADAPAKGGPWSTSS
jgi:outer membrane protein assembly factor BamA